MSLYSLCQKHSVVVKTQTNSKTAGGAAIKAWTTGARTVKCNRQGIASADLVAFGIRAGRRGWKLFTDSNPDINEQCHVFFDEFDGTAVEASVTQPSRSEVQGLGGKVVWLTVLEEFRHGQAS